MLKQIQGFSSRYISTRNLTIWLPPGYFNSNDDTFPVIYMHDGQNLFLAETSYTGHAWNIDKSARRLIKKRAIREPIIVGIWNTPRRLQEYMPQKATALLKDKAKEAFYAEYGQPCSDAYLYFLVKELKAYIDNEFRTAKESKNTFIMGSSMGGLISLYALCEYPDIFGGAACLSTHWPAGKGVMLKYLEKNLPPAGDHKLYFDFGTETIDKPYQKFQKKADEIIKAGGYIQNKNWITQKFPGADHSEQAWSKRIHNPLRFFLKI